MAAWHFSRRIWIAGLPATTCPITEISSQIWSRWAATERIPLSVEGPGLLDCHLYRQSDRLILHLVNLTSTGSWRAPVDELIPIGPLRVKIKLPPGLSPQKPRLMVSGESVHLSLRDRWAIFDIKTILDHEMVVL